MKKTQRFLTLFVCLAANAAAQDPAKLDDPDKLSVAIYPLFAWVPSFSTSLSIPPFTNGGGNTEGSTPREINGALAFAGGVTVNKWLFEGEATFLEATSTRNTPNLQVNTSLDYANFFVGRYVGKGLYVIGGARHMSLEVEALVSNGNAFTVKPSTWDPQVGLEWRKALGRKVLVQARFDGGGFGVGTDLDISAQGRLEWRFIKHMSAVVGYQVLHTRSSGSITRTGGIAPGTYPWNYNQTFVGPILGVGIHF